MPNQINTQVNVTAAKRKIEEQVILPVDSSQSQQQQIVRPKAIERTKKSQMKEQKYFPPGPQKVIRTPIHILKREVPKPPPETREDNT